MSEAQEPVRIHRWPDKPTSGRFVYKGTSQWYWQCDLHPEEYPPDDQWGQAATMQEAVAGALEHARVCPFRAVQIFPIQLDNG